MHSKNNPVCCRRTHMLLTAVAVVLLSAVCVGAVSGAVFPNVYTEKDLRDAVVLANNNGEDDKIIIKANILLTTSDSIIIEGGRVTIVSEYGKEFEIERADSSYSSRKNLFGFITYNLYSPIFSVIDTGELVLGESGYGSLTLDGGGTGGDTGRAIEKPGGGAVYVDGGSFTMNDGVTISGFGRYGTELTGNGAVYINTGTFVMNGGSIKQSVSMMGSGVYVGSGSNDEPAVFEMYGGEITENGHDGYEILWIPIVSNTYGGGVYVEDGGWLVLSDINLVHDNAGDPEIVYSDPSTSTIYTVVHCLETTEKGTYTEDKSLRQIIPATSGKYTNAEALLIPGYAKPDTVSVTQKKITKDGTTVITINYPRSITYIISIPDTLVISEETNSGSMEITVSNLWIPEKNAVSLTVSSPTELQSLVLKDSSATLSYSLSKDGQIIRNHGEVASFTMDKQDSVILGASYSGTPLYSGEYSDTLTFRAECIEGGALSAV